MSHIQGDWDIGSGGQSSCLQISEGIDVFQTFPWQPKLRDTFCRNLVHIYINLGTETALKTNTSLYYML